MAGRKTQSDSESFLLDLELRLFKLEGIDDLEPIGLAIGPGSGGLEVIVTRAGHRPTQDTLRKAWKARQGRRAVPVLLATLYGTHAALCGPSGDQPPVYLDLDPAQAEAICRAALQEPNRHAALRLLHSVLPEIRETAIPGLYNAGLFATHELLHGVPDRPDWDEAQRKSRELKTKRGRALLESLGYQVNDTTQQYSILRTTEGKIAVAVFLDRAEATDTASERFSGMTPVQYALAKADEENLDYVVVDHGASLRIYSAGTGIGVGRRGRTETFVEAHLGLLPDDRAGYLWLLFSGEALARAGGAFNEILERSNDYAAGLGGRLRERIYDDVVPLLAVAIARARNLVEPSPEELTFTYEMALTTLFRLLFIAYAEDKDLLPYRSNELYKARSLKQKARELGELRRGGRSEFDESTSMWDEVFGLFRVVDTGMPKEWGVPAYNGGLFSDREEVSPAGAALAGLRLPNSAFGGALTSLLVDETPEGIGPVDFRSLGVREFGTIYEGLLSSELSVAETPLAIDRDGFYVPAAPEQDAEVAGGECYLHDTSGKRKSTGSYYTKTFAVDHLLDHALEPALKEHLKRIDDQDDRAAAAAFFDFRVADIAMGSGHFLVAAVDRIERGLGSYLVKRPLPDVVAELRRLNNSAVKEMESAAGSADGLDIDNDQLLRRQIARRCVYGVDINPVAVQLARLSLWIHTFVPGLPLSFLDHNIVCGNSLVGIATMDEVADILGGGEANIFTEMAEQYLAPARDGMERLAILSDADASQIEEAREVAQKAREATSGTEALFDVLTAARLPEMNYTPSVTDLSEAQLTRLREKARALLQETLPFHFPIAFPEVFLRQRAGFDVIIGNPPWEKTQVEEHEFWARYVPGLRGLSQSERERIYKQLKKERPDLVEQFQSEVDIQETFRYALMNGPYPGMGAGHPDLYKAFCWRFWHLICCDGGRLGVVLPRSALSAKGSTEFRREVFSGADEVEITTLLNSRGWVFDEAEHRYTIGLVALEKRRADRSRVVLRGPYSNLRRYRDGMVREPAIFYGNEIESWNDTSSLPLLPTEESVEVFAQLRKAPRLDMNDSKTWRARPLQGDLNATNGKPLMDLKSKECPSGFWAVFKGESFDLWNPDTGGYYAWADPKIVLPKLRDTRVRSRKNSRSPYSEFVEKTPEWFADTATLPCNFARIAFRDVTNRTNRRTVIAALVPPGVFITHQAPTFLWPRGDEKDQAFLLGMLSSIPMDWYARRFVETHLTYHVINPFPIPRPDRENLLWQQTVGLSGCLACPDERFATWAEAVGVECGPLEAAQKDDMIRELDAVVAHLYGLSEPQLRHIFETFHEGWVYEDRLAAVLKHFQAWSKKL